jgi:3D (Asp-Asp-Asp) domain-containing protein
MNCFILRWILVLGCLAGLTPVQAALNSKRPASLPPTLLQAAAPALSATHKAAQVAATMARTTGNIVSQEVTQAEAKARKMASASGEALGNRLARLTAYWSGEGDYYTRRHISATGIRLHNGHCAVDPTIIPYGSVVQIEGLGSYLAVDTGTAVVSRRAARESGHNRLERHALVIDLYFEDRSDGERFAATGPKFATISWRAPEADSSAPSLVAFNDTSHGRTL